MDISSIIKSMLYGKHTHANPEEVARALSPEIARTRIEDCGHSIWELLYHMAYWQDMVILAHKNDAAAKKANDKDSWPTKEQMLNDDDFEAVKKRFLEGLTELSQLAEGNLERESEIWPGATLAHNLMIEIGHNSYHLGQIVVILSANNLWPIQNDSDT